MKPSLHYITLHYGELLCFPNLKLWRQVWLRLRRAAATVSGCSSFPSLRSDVHSDSERAATQHSSEFPLEAARVRGARAEKRYSNSASKWIRTGKVELGEIHKAVGR